LVYLSVTQEFSKNLKTYHLIDRPNGDFIKGVEEVEYSTQNLIGKTILGFYSSCTGEPHRFQFIYLDNLAEVATDEDRIIITRDC
jgi:hypothetical protein